MQLEKESNIIREEYTKTNSKCIALTKLQSSKQKIENEIKILYNKKLEENITIEQFKKQYKDLKLKESAIKEQIEQLKKEHQKKEK